MGEAAQAQTTSERNKEIIRYAWNAIFNEMDLSVCDEVIAEDYTYQGKAPEGSAPDSVKQFARLVKATYPDVYFDVLDVLGDGDKVAIRYTVEGHWVKNNELDKTMATNILTMADGKIFSNWQTGGTMKKVDHPQGAPEAAY